MTAKEYPSFTLPTLRSGVEEPSDSHASRQAAASIVNDWASQFNALLLHNDRPDVSALFHPEGWLRDSLTMTWDLRTLHGRASITQHFKDNNAKVHLRNIEPRKVGSGQAYAPEVVRAAPDVEWVQSMFTFETSTGTGKGLVRLVQGDNGGWQIYIMSLIFQEFDTFPERTWANRPHGGDNSSREGPAGAAWKEFREKQQQFLNENPTTLIVGAGQAGLDLAARLNQLGVSNLVVDRNPRVGDNWRQRYKTLVLHDPVHICHMPYLEFPPTWPLFTPKDKLADWFESYAKLMDLNVWTGTTVRSARFNEDTGSWTVHLRLPDNSTRVLKPTYFVLATGHSGEPLMPRFEGMDTFGGTVYHTSQHQDAADFGDLSGKKVVVVGTGNSGHDIAQDYQQKGADVTMVQRGATVVVSVEKGVMPTFKGLYDDNSPPIEDADIYLFSFPWKVKFALDGIHTSAWRKEAAGLLDGLSAAGFALRYGTGSEGLYKQYITVGGGYYLDIGCSQLIAEGKIKVKRDEGGVKAFDRSGIVLMGGEKVQADIVVLATGFDNMRTTARKLVGDRVADRLKDVWGLDEEGEMNAMWRHSGHPKFFYMGGNFLLCRFYSRLLAMQIKAIEEGLYVPNR
ncbi:hypothetical protein NLU13_3096 [Sarocladium strictum]|uniref:Uncharacterized protein n=1 Tax=Sarocladium strictum TaxID=5046 RepID=A0AA39L9E8_SARSR|nr:hypothetical protein NLU13_3096 [Sarocladium strictum]